MEFNSVFFQSIVNNIPDTLVIINQEGDIIFVNERWLDFDTENRKIDFWTSTNYLDVCLASYKYGDVMAKTVHDGILSVIQGMESSFYYEYPCHNHDERRWFLMHVTPLKENPNHYVITHQNITSRYLEEQKALQLSLLDELTQIPNRRAFNAFLKKEWNRCQSNHLPITLAMLDIDHFKLLNDAYGHQKGDESLQCITTIFNQHIQKDTELCARYGGEEFAFIFSEKTHQDIQPLLRSIQQDIQALQIPNQHSPVSHYLTVSMGVQTLCPSQDTQLHQLIDGADHLLYQAKKNGRNQILYSKRSKEEQNSNVNNL